MQTYLRRYREAAGRQSEGFFPVDARIISRAVLPIEPYFPKVIPYTFAGAFSMMVLSVIAVLSAALLSGAGMQPVGRVVGGYVPEPVMFEPVGQPETEISDDAIVEPEEIVFRQGQTAPASLDPVAGENPLPEISNVPPMAPANTGSAGGSGNKSLAIRYASSVLVELDGARIITTSPGGDAGSRTTWMLGRSLARAGRKVMIVDLSGGGLTSHEMLGSTELPGLFDMVLGNAAFEDVVYRDKLSQVHVIPAGNLVLTDNPPDLEDVSIVINTISEPYEFVLIDCGDADPSGIEAMSSPSDIVVISGIGAQQSDCDALEGRIQATGYEEVIQIVPDSVDAEKEALVAA